MKTAIEFQTKPCHTAKYSNGGQFLAAASGSVIQIIDPYTFEVKHELHGHPSHVKSLEWN